jgi:hypothetical protein
MSECHLLSDRMPGVALGAVEWTLGEAQHLRTCRSCQEEWNLVERSGYLGREAGLQLDADSSSRILLDHLQRARLARQRRRSWSFVGLAAAASIATVIWKGRPTAGPTYRPPTVVGVQIALPELDSLPPAELDSVLHSMDEPSTESTFDDLEGFLDSWEG